MTFETLKNESGKIIIAFSDSNISFGYLEINPAQEFKKHNRPCSEHLYQIKGTTTMILFSENGDQENVVLNEGDTLEIPGGKFHIHANRGNEQCITLWKALGDITQILNNIRKESKM